MKLFLSFVIILAGIEAFGQISGPASAVAGQTCNYSYSTSTIYVDPWLDPGSFGILVSESQNGLTYHATIRWTTIGTGIIKFKNGGTTVSSKSVTIAAPAAPTTSFTQTYKCHNTIVRRQTSPSADYDWYWQISSTGSSTTLGKLDSISITSSAPLYLRTRSKYSPYPWSTTFLPIGTISTVSPLSAPSSSTHAHLITNPSAQVTLSVSSVNGSTAYWWYQQASGGSPIAGQTMATYSPTLAQTKTYYVTSVNGDCPSTTRTAVMANIYPEPVITATNNGLVSMGNSVILSASNYSYDTYQWLDGNGNAISGATTPTYSAKIAGSYKLRVKKDTSPNFTTTAYVVRTGLSTIDMNYIISNTILKNRVAVAEVDTLSVNTMSQTIQYFDGLGRPMQTISTQASPSRLDIVTPVVYDAFGREKFKFLPIATGSDGYYKPNESIVDPVNGGYINAAASFYGRDNSTIASDSRPFSETIFEPSPLNRPLRQFGPGVAWKDNRDPDNRIEKPVSHDYLINEHGIGVGQERVIVWHLDANGLLVRAPAVADYVETGGYYSTGQLNIKSTKDEQGNEVREYIDKEGHTILKKVQAIKGIAQTNNDSHWAMTYYIYDDLGNLAVVLPPEGVKELTK